MLIVQNVIFSTFYQNLHKYEQFCASPIKQHLIPELQCKFICDSLFWQGDITTRKFTKISENVNFMRFFLNLPHKRKSWWLSSKLDLIPHIPVQMPI